MWYALSLWIITKGNEWVISVRNTVRFNPFKSQHLLNADACFVEFLFVSHFHSSLLFFFSIQYSFSLLHFSLPFIRCVQCTFCIEFFDFTFHFSFAVGIILNNVPHAFVIRFESIRFFFVSFFIVMFSLFFTRAIYDSSNDASQSYRLVYGRWILKQMWNSLLSVCLYLGTSHECANFDK